jgi:hypothetical protein
MKKKLDWHKGFELCLKNSMDHMEIANLSKSVSLGIAHGHIVLAGEEAVKAMVLFNISYDPDVLNEMEDFDEYFSNHKHKHETIRNLEHTGLLLEKMMMIQMSPFQGFKGGDLSFEEVKVKAIEGRKKMIQWMSDLVDDSKPEVNLKTNDAWWRQAEIYKKEGFYVDILKKQKDWSGPHKCSEKKFHKGRKVVESFISKVQFIEENFQDEDVIELYKELKESSKRIS